MKLPPDLTFNTLKDLRHYVMQQPDQKPDHLEMSDAQYSTYTRLVYETDYIRNFMGIRITLSPKKASTDSDGSV